MPAGRPSKYQPRFCLMLIEHMKQGYSYESFAHIAGVHVDTLYQWEIDNPEFSDAKKKAVPGALYFWEGLGIQGIRGEIENFNVAGWIFNMKARFQWRDHRDININGLPPAQNTTVIQNNINFKQLPSDEIVKVLLDLSTKEVGKLPEST